MLLPPHIWTGLRCSIACAPPSTIARTLVRSHRNSVIFPRAHSSSTDVFGEKAQLVRRGGLYVVGTPIGNLQDLSPRALGVLRSVDRIYCEDTRHTSRLCNALDIRCPLESLHQHNERRKLDQVRRGG